MRTDQFEIRLAESPAEVEAAQRLRYEVFYLEHGATPTPEVAKSGLDVDPYDYCCDHLLVIDRDRSSTQPCVVGTYRMMRKHAALSNGGFYSAQEYDLDNLIRLPDEIVEVGRSCVHADYRRGAVMQLLWAGIAKYLAENNIKVLFGCASFAGTDPATYGKALAYLHEHHLAPSDYRPRALEHRHVEMALLAEGPIEQREALVQLPPLLKGYIRLGGKVGDGAVIDHEFNTVDVCMVVTTDRLTEKYQRHFRPSGTA